MTNDSTNSDNNLLKNSDRVLEKLLWQLPRKVVIDLLLELRSQLTDADNDALDKRISELVATKEDRKRAWLEEHAEALEVHAKHHHKKID